MNLSLIIFNGFLYLIFQKNEVTFICVCCSVNVQIVDKDGKINNVRGKVGDNLLYLAKRFEVEMEGKLFFLNIQNIATFIFVINENRYRV